MVRPVLRISLLAFLCSFVLDSCLLAGSFPSQVPLPEGWQSEAQTAWNKYLEFSHSLQGHEVQTRFHPMTGAIVGTLEIDFQQAKDCVFVQEKRQGSETEFAEVANRDYSFRISRSKPGDPWVMKDGDSDPQGLRFRRSSLATVARPITEFPLFIDGDSTGLSLPLLFESPVIKITGAQQRQLPTGEKTVEIDWEVSVDGMTGNDATPALVAAKDPTFRSVAFRRGTIVLLPERYWVIQEIRGEKYVPTEAINDYSRVQFRKAYEYADVDGFPVIRHAEQTVTLFLPGDPNSIKVADAKQVSWEFDFRAQTIPESQFRLTAFGLPEFEALASEENPSRSFWWLYLAVTAIIAMGAAFLFLRNKRRKL